MHWLSRCGEFSCRKRSYHGREFAKNLVFVGRREGEGTKGAVCPGPPVPRAPKFQSILFAIHIAKHLQTAPSLGILPQVLSCAAKLLKWKFSFERACVARWQTYALIRHLLKFVTPYLADMQLESII